MSVSFIHCDQADRFIIATAKKLNAAIVTGDKRFDSYDVRIIH
jgi:PIN domain nuclease of toxin-antitoxin system